MANHSLSEAEKQAEAQKKIAKGAAWGAVAWLVGKAIVGEVEKGRREQLQGRMKELEETIRNIDNQIANYERNWLKSAWYADEISALKAKRAEYQAELSEIKKQLG